jgi:hypothetical protein
VLRTYRSVRRDQRRASRWSLSIPELDVAAAAMVAEGVTFVVVGGFAVIANRFVRATEDVDFLDG